uniref:Uncharacterized protein n=1 Tax=Arundo donax TaxID=35708 RepID=A0A0A9DQX8_ARUDO
MKVPCPPLLTNESSIKYSSNVLYIVEKHKLMVPSFISFPAYFQPVVLKSNRKKKLHVPPQTISIQHLPKISISIFQLQHHISMQPVRQHKNEFETVAKKEFHYISPNARNFHNSKRRTPNFLRNLSLVKSDQKVG